MMLAIVLAVAMVLSACSSNGNSGSSASPSPSGGDAGASPAASGTIMDDGPLGKYNPPIELTAVRDLITGSPEAKMQDNIINQYYENDLGIKVNYKWTVIGDQYEQRVNLALTSGDIPDVMTVNLRQLQQMIDADQVADLTEAWDAFATEQTKEAMTADGTASFDLATKDGKLYGIPLVVPVAETAHALFLREDWRQKLNLPEPKTYADFEQIMYAFAQNNPKGDNSKTYGLNITKDLYSNGFDITSFANMFHAYPNAWVDDGNGNVVYGSVQPEMKQALAALQKLYKDGLIDKEFMVRDEEKAGEAVLKEQVGAFFGVQWTQFIASGGVDLYKRNLESELKVYPLPSVDDRVAKPIVYDNTSQFYVVRKGYEHPEAIIKMLNWIHKMGRGPQDIPYEEWKELWVDWGYALIKPETIHANMQRWLNTFEALATGDDTIVNESYLNKEQYEDVKKFYEQGEDLRKSDNEEDKEWAKVRWGWTKSGEVFKIANEYRNNGNLEVDRRGSYVSPIMIEKQSTLTKLEQTAFTRIISGTDPIDAFDKFVSEWENLGGKDITAELNAWYKN